jgi:hypothetical protein
VAKARERLPAGTWVHLAGVYDGRQIALFVNGQKAASTNATGARLSSDKSLYVGARPNGAFNTHNFSYPMIYWRGAVDDVRVSRIARYTRNFRPEQALAADVSTVFAMSNDRQVGPFVPLEGAAQAQAIIKGLPVLVPAER